MRFTGPLALLLACLGCGGPGPGFRASGTEGTGLPGPLFAYVVTLRRDPSGRFLYVREGSGRAVAALAVDPANGRLLRVEGSPIVLDDAERSRVSCYGQGRLAIDDNGEFLVSSNCRADSLEVLRIDPASGALRRLQGSPFATGSNPRSVTLFRPRP